MKRSHEDGKRPGRAGARKMNASKGVHRAQPTSSLPHSSRVHQIAGTFTITSTAAGYQLEGSPSLAPADFQPVLPLLVVVEGRNTVTHETAGTGRFYRLYKP